MRSKPLGPAAAYALTTLTLGAAGTELWAADDSQRILTVDHYVLHESTVPAISGDAARLYVRERVKAGTVLRASDLAGQVVLFVHGAGTPAEVAFDVPYEDYSWMAYLADAGLDVFAMDVTGYGRSTRPGVMNDPCNLSPEQRTALSMRMPSCDSGYERQLNTIQSDWDDIAAVVDYVRRLRDVERVSLIGWSLGGPRAGGYAAAHPEQVEKLVLLAPAYTRDAAADRPSRVPADGVPMNKQSHEDFIRNWDRQVGCDAQYDLAAAESIWSQMLESDGVGATWGPGVRRAPNTTVWGWNRRAVEMTETPTLLVTGIHDKQVAPERVRDLYEDLGSERKVLIDLGCSSHNAMWERNHRLLFRASLRWLVDGAVEGAERGILQMGY
jgi:pimeloyl-ACP methyl ester carboxylesterase